MTRVHVRPEAVTDVEEAIAWYEEQQPGLGVEFLLELDSAIDLAAESPKLYQVQYRNVRRILVRRFPYAVYFVCDDDVVEIFAVLHQRRNPAAWQSRVL